MTAGALRHVPTDALRLIAADLANVRIIPDEPRLRAIDAMPTHHCAPVAEALLHLGGPARDPGLVAAALLLLADERERLEREAPRVEVVWSGPEAGTALHRTTLAVVQELFLTFRHSLLISSYSLDSEQHLRTILTPLAERMDAEPELEVRFFLDLRASTGPHVETAGAAQTLFARRFQERLWPGQRLPQLWYDPRAFDTAGQRAVLHAKCIVADDDVAFVTSANLSEAAQERNVELGVLLRDRSAVRDIRAAFDALVSSAQVAALVVP